jgi:hypothetical protein
MNARPRTIQIFLPDGDPHGVRVAELTTRTIRLFDVPRSLLGRFREFPEAGQVGLYFLFSADDASGSTSCYVGQSGNVGGRLGSHDQNKDFWDRALIVVSLTDTMTDTHARYLESRSIESARSAGRFDIENGNKGTRPHTPPPLQADCEEFLDTIQILIGTVGFPVFDALPTADQVEPDKTVYCRARGADASGTLTPEGMVVFKGSRCAAKPTPAATPHAIHKQRERLFEQGVLTWDGDTPTFSRDHVFRSPSGAACAVIFRNANGWREWRTEDGRKLNQVAGRSSTELGSTEMES